MHHPGSNANMANIDIECGKRTREATLFYSWRPPCSESLWEVGAALRGWAGS